MQYNQKQVLNQVESEVNKYLLEIYRLSHYLKDNYLYEKDNYLLKNIVDTNTNISSILVLDSEGIIRDFYAPTNLNIFKGFDYSKKSILKILMPKQMIIGQIFFYHQLMKPLLYHIVLNQENKFLF